MKKPHNIYKVIKNRRIPAHKTRIIKQKKKEKIEQIQQKEIENCQ